MSEAYDMLKQAAEALAHHEREAEALRGDAAGLRAKLASADTKVAAYAGQMETITELLVTAGFDVGEKRAFVHALQAHPEKLANVLRDAFAHFTTAPSSGSGYTVEPAVSVTTSRWRL